MPYWGTLKRSKALISNKKQLIKSQLLYQLS
jgi:hypothetical protein